jgi:hypothetical protein
VVAAAGTHPVCPLFAVGLPLMGALTALLTGAGSGTVLERPPTADPTFAVDACWPGVTPGEVLMLLLHVAGVLLLLPLMQAAVASGAQ